MSRAYEVGVIGRDWSQTIFAPTSGRAKYLYLRELQDAYPDAQFKHLRCRSLGDIPIPPTRVELAQQECDRFNAAYPVGTRLAYWTFLREGGPTGVAPIKHKATVMCEHAVIWLEGVRSCISITHVEVAN